MSSKYKVGDNVIWKTKAAVIEGVNVVFRRFTAYYYTIKVDGRLVSDVSENDLKAK